MDAYKTEPTRGSSSLSELRFPRRRELRPIAPAPAPCLSPLSSPQIRGVLAAFRGSDPESGARRRARTGHDDRDHGPLVPMAPPPDHGSGSGAATEAATAAAGEMRRQASCDCAVGREEPTTVARHERRLSASSASSSISSPAASPARSTSTSSSNYLPASNKLSSESIPFAPPDLSSFSHSSSSSSYESFFHIEASDLGAAAGSAEYLDFEPAATQAPGVQTMMQAQGQQQRPAPAPAAYDSKRLPSSMFRTRSTSPAEWSGTSNDSLFSIQLSNCGDLTAFYADMYYDAAGFPHFHPMGGEAALKHSESSSVRSGGLCVRHDCARCSGSGGKTRKSVRFAATESVSTTDGKHSVVISTLEVAMEEEDKAVSATKAPAAGWCELGCRWPSPTTSWWPRCCVCCGCGCQCKWWL